MRILLASAPVINREIKFNLQTLLEYMKDYRGKVELIVFGESILQGFECLCWDYEKDRSVGIALEDAPVRRIRAAAKEYRLAVSFGMIERRGDHLYSAQLTIGEDGELVNLFHRVSVGWKDISQTDEHYREGELQRKKLRRRPVRRPLDGRTAGRNEGAAGRRGAMARLVRLQPRRMERHCQGRVRPTGGALRP